ncbi:NADPH:quinone reductase [Actinomycetota bacterium]|nr:NADPH:quinone reductase [Actinomycetota bacterium]
MSSSAPSTGSSPTLMPAVGYLRPLPVSDPSSLLDLELPVPTLRPHDLLVEVRAVSVNPVDVKQRTRAVPTGGPRVLGFDASGTVRAVGPEVTLFAPGDDVFYAGSIDRPGTNSLLHAVDERIVGPKPTSLDHTDAAALPLTSITAWETLVDRFRLGAASTGTLLVLGAAGGVGSVLVQLARALTGLTVIGTASRPETAAWVREMGAHHVVDHSDKGALVAQVREIAPGGVTHLFTPHSAGMVPTFAELLAPFGEITAIDDPGVADVAPLKAKSLTWHWELMFTRPVQQTADMITQHRLLAEVSRMVDAGVLRSTAQTRLAGIDAATLRHAHTLVESGRTIGKVVLTR